MGIISRLLLVMYVLAVTAVLVAAGGASLQIIPENFGQNELDAIIYRQETLAVIVVMLLAGFCLIHSALSGGKKVEEILSGEDVELRSGTAEQVKVTILAITSVVERAALTVPGVREVKADVAKKVGEVPIKIKLDIVLSQGYAAPEVSAKINAAVSGALKETLQIGGVEAEIRVTEVTHAITERERRVV